MCGLILWIKKHRGGFAYSDSEVFENLLVMDSLRGRDSTGVTLVKNSGSALVIKQARDPFMLFRNREWDDFKTEMAKDGRVVMGHNRAATFGEKITENAHPFVEDNIVLMHNGTLRDHSNLTKETVSVDSQAIAKALKEAGGDASKVIPKIRGAFALIWYDVNTEKIYAIRNADRPLYFLETDNAYVLVSEPWMAYTAFNRGNRVVTKFKEESSHMLKPGELMTYSLGDNKVSFSDIDLTPLTTITTYAGGAYMGEREVHSRFNDDDDDTIWQGYEAGSRTGGNSENPKVPALLTPLPDSSQTKQKPTGGSTSGGSTEDTSLVAEGSGSSIIQMFDDEGLQIRNKILIQVTTCQPLDVSRFRFYGKCIEPGVQMVDVVGILPTPAGGSNMSWAGAQIVGTIENKRATQCGMTVNVSDCELAPIVPTNNGTVSLRTWHQHALFCKCKECGNIPLNVDRRFTDVILKPDTTSKVMPVTEVVLRCADCVAKHLPEGDIREKFELDREKAHEEAENTDRDSSVQNGQRGSRRTSRGNGKAIILPPSTSLQ